MVLSRLLLGRRHSWIHFIGVVSCMVGVMYNALADYESDMVGSVLNGGKEYPYKLKGDILAVIGGVLFGASDVLAEMAVRNFGGPTEFLGMMGLFATVISLVQASILEGEEILHFFNGVPEPDGKTCSTSTGLLLLFAFVLSNVVSYTATAWFLLISEATFLNLSLLTGDLWSVLFMVVAEGIVPQPLFWAALTMITSGVVIYEIAPPSTGRTEGETDFRLVRRRPPKKSENWDMVSVHEDDPHLAEGVGEIELL
jgi:solute carrier family 35 protein F1/2